MNTVSGSRTRHALRCLLLLLSLSTWLLQEAYGQAVKAQSFRDRVTDRVTLVDGLQLHGMALQKNPLQIVIRTAWLNTHGAELLREEVTPALRMKPAEPSPLASALETEITALKKSNPDDRQRAGLLLEIQQRLLPDEDALPEFLIVEVPGNRIKRVDYQSDARRELCRLAIVSRLEDYEQTHWKSLAEQLRTHALSRPQPGAEPNDDAADHLPKVLAACDVRLNSATRLIRQGDQIFDESAPPDMGTLITTMLGGNLQNLLSELLDERPLNAQRPGQGAAGGRTLPAMAIQMAAAKSQKTVVLAGFDFDLAGGSANVSRQLFRQMPDGQWKLLITATGNSSVADLQPGEADAMADDPQLREISTIVSGLGIGNDQLRNAFQLGAVVQKAQKHADQVFEQQIQDIITTRSFTDSRKPPVIALQEKTEP